MKYRQTILGLAALMGAASAHAVVDPSLHYDNANNFSVASNPSGVWSYGYELSLGGAFNAFNTAGTLNGMEAWYTPEISSLGTPVVYHNATDTPITAVSATVYGYEAGFHPGPSSLAIYRFTAPAANTYKVEAFFFTQDTNATGVDVYVMKNNNAAPLFSSKLAYDGAGNSNFWQGNVNLAAGQTLEFAVGNAGNYYYDSTGLGVQIAAVPEPRSYALFGVGIGLVGLALRRRKSKYDRAVIY